MQSHMKWIDQGINGPKGFYCGGLHSGVKRKRKDLSLIYSKAPCSYAGVFTKNVVKAAPVLWNTQLLMDGASIHSVIVNSGNANACTGEKGKLDCETMAKQTADLFDILPDNVLVASTGVIGLPLDMEKISKGISNIKDRIGIDKEHADAAAEGIMTTDNFTKVKSIEIEIQGKTVTIAGMSKGSGMIHPNMGTMLSFITTDANIESEVLKDMLSKTVNKTYNMISVDGDTSTNDMVLVLANGESGTDPITMGSMDYELFFEAFYQLNEELAKLIVKDGEGATKFIEVQVNQMTNEEEAAKMVHSVITSNLVKTAFFGEDANWGRILCALGYSGADFDPALVDVHYISNGGDIVLIKDGAPVGFDEEYALEILEEKELKVIVNCHRGESSAKGWGCDLSYDYVKINGEYRT